MNRYFRDDEKLIPDNRKPHQLQTVLKIKTVTYTKSRQITTKRELSGGVNVVIQINS